VRPGARAKYQSGGAWLACRAQVPVLPVAHNAGDLWPRNGFFKYPGTVTVSIGPAMAAANRKAEDLNQEIEAWIEREMQRIGNAREAR
jgi:1-acyl-sn-glycerol-3-phosphate acyltransferase